jgi:hypothetical protein
MAPYAAASSSARFADVARQLRFDQGLPLGMQLAFNKPVRIPSWAVVSFTNPQYTGNDLQVRSMHCTKE